MTRYSVQYKVRVFVKGYGILPFASAKYSQNLFVNTKQCATDALKTISKRAIQKTAEATSDLIGNKSTDKIIKVSRTSSKNSLETAKSKPDK